MMYGTLTKIGAFLLICGSCFLAGAEWKEDELYKDAQKETAKAANQVIEFVGDRTKDAVVEDRAALNYNAELEDLRKRLNEELRKNKSGDCNISDAERLLLNELADKASKP